MTDTIFKPREISIKGYSDIKIDSRRFKAVDELQEEEAKEYTKEDMIRAFVQGAKYGWYQSDGIAGFDKISRAEAEEEAKELLEQGELGKDEE